MPNTVSYPRGLRDIKIANEAETTIIDVPARSLQWSERITSAELEADDTIVASASSLAAVDFQLESGGYPIEAVALMTGRTVGTTGTTPNVEKTFAINEADAYPYFVIYGLAIGADGDSITVKFHKCKLTAAPNGTFSQNQYFLTGWQGTGIGDGSGDVVTFTWNETAASLPAVAP